MAWHSESMDLRVMITGVNDILIRTMVLLRNQFDASLTNFEETFERYVNLNHRVLTAKGIDPNTVPV